MNCGPGPGPPGPGPCPVPASGPRPFHLLRALFLRAYPLLRGTLAPVSTGLASACRESQAENAHSLSPDRPAPAQPCQSAQDGRIVGRVRAHQRLHRQLRLLKVGPQIDQLSRCSSMMRPSPSADRRSASAVPQSSDCSTSPLRALPLQMPAAWAARWLPNPWPTPARRRNPWAPAPAISNPATTKTNPACSCRLHLLLLLAPASRSRGTSSAVLLSFAY
jgi:hypothetical protein